MQIKRKEKGKRQIDWDDVKQCLEGYVGDYYEIAENAKYGWYRYDVHFALPVYEENALVRYNIFHARLLINHAEKGRKSAIGIF